MKSAAKLLGALAAVALVGTAVSGAALGLELRVVYAAYPELYEDLATQFEALHPDIDVVTESTGASYAEFTQMVLRGATVDDLPDIAVGSSNHVRLFAERDMLEPLSGYLADDPDWASLGYIQSSLADGVFNGTQFGIPYGVAEPVIFFNADLVRAAGGDPDNFPKDWDGIIELAARINALPSGEQGFFMSHYEHTSNWTYVALLQSVGGKMVNEDETKVAFDDEDGLWALNMFRRFAQEAGQLDISREQARQMVAAGQLGIFASSSSFIGQFAEAAEGHFEARIAPWPVPEADGTLPPAGNAAMIFKTDDAEKRDAAWEFVKFAAGPAGQATLLKYTGYAPSNQIAIDSPEYLGNFYKDNPIYQVTIDQLPKLTSWYAFPSKNALQISEVIRDYIQEVATLKRTPEEVMPDMARDVQALLVE